jgi:hypothetical protein
MAIKFANNAYATLASSLTSSATSITLTTGEGARFPAASSPDYFYATLLDSANNLEIVKVTNRSTDVLTVVRAQESTTARAYAIADRIELRITAAALEAISEATLAGDGLDLTGSTLSLDLKSSGGLTIDTTELKLDTANVNSWTGKQTLKEITETEATSSASTYTIDLANGTLFEVTHATLCTVTMPTAAAGKSFTVISTVPAAWSGTILWSGGAAPTTGSAKTIYSFISNGSSWYGMQAGTGFA